MPLALVFTSAPQGLAPGRSGFCTVARHAEMPARLAELLEGFGTPHGEAGSATFTLRRLEAGGRGWHVLSRFTAGGLDYTRRDNRLAHHLAFTDAEVAALPPPADVAARWQGWVSEWPEPPRWLDAEPLRLGPGRPLVPCSAWRRATGTGAKAAWLLNGDHAGATCLVNAPGTAGLLELLAESAALLGPASWSATFTTDAQVTGSDGFAWCGGETGSRRRVDLASAGDEPAPEGDKARLAALGVSARAATAAAPRPTAHPEAGRSAAIPRWAILATLGVTLLAALAILAVRRAPETARPEPAATAPRAPTPAEMAAAAQLLRANDALRDLQDVVARGDLVTAARQWSEISRLSPEFTARHRDQFIPRIQAGIALAATDALERQLATPGTSEDNRALERLLTEAGEALRAASEIGAPRDAAWARLEAVESRLRMLAQMDIRDTLLVTGQWVTASAGPTLPSAADFDLGKEAGEAIGRFLREGLTGGAGTSTPVTLRLCQFRGIAQRDATARPVRSLLQPGASSLWVSEDTGGARRPLIALSVGSRANTVSLNFPGPAPAGFTQSNQAVEVTNASGRRLCIALLSRPEALEPLRPGLAGLAADPGTQATGPAVWLEPVFNRVRMAGARIALHPAGHELPERVATLSVTRNVLETDLIRLGSGTAGTPRSEVADRRRRLESGDPVGAGAPWTIRFVDARGNPLATLAEFR